MPNQRFLKRARSPRRETFLSDVADAKGRRRRFAQLDTFLLPCGS